jgi:anaerobic dimethyl sulfoxide reductase subunit B (iron-sulfur subunit)
MQMGFYFDQTRCTGCFTCSVACKDWHDIPAGQTNWLRVMEIEKGKFPNVFVAYLVTGCRHCANPACVTACPVGAISKRQEDGVVVVDQEVCLGKDNCDMCLQACPYEAPQFGTEQNAKMQKCNFCIDRLAEGKYPICVEACPMRALDAGPLDQLMTKYGQSRDAEGFVHSAELDPSVVFNPKLALAPYGGFL